MAIHTGRHRDVLLFPQRIALTHGAMTGFAGRSGLGEMFLVAEKDVIGQAIDTPPLHRFVLLVKGSQALDGGALFLHRTMAAHAGGGLGNDRKISGLGYGVAGFAVESLSDGGREVFWGLPEYLPE